MKTSKVEETLVYACGKLAQSLDDGNRETAECISVHVSLYMRICY